LVGTKELYKEAGSHHLPTKYFKITLIFYNLTCYGSLITMLRVVSVIIGTLISDADFGYIYDCMTRAKYNIAIYDSSLVT
jgi:hypothetical protein